jgi:ribosomal protein S18 acetylase RimI-like enzyme
MEIKYRPGEKEDSNKIAEMINTASDGIVEYLFHDLVPEMSSVQVVAHNLENDNYPHTYMNAVVACDRNDLVGMALSYPSSYHRITDEMRDFYSPEKLERFSAFYSSRAENTWFLDSFCVIESHRRRGIGEKLISLIKETAVKNGYNAVSLIVFADNALAIPVYERTGFEVIQKIELQGNEYIRHEDACLLMKCEITTT